MAEKSELEVVCPNCRTPKIFKIEDINDPETAMLIEKSTTNCNKCGQSFALAGNINHSNTKMT